MNPLNRYPKVREVAYTIQWIVSGVLGVAGVVLVSIDPKNIPLWYTIATGVASYAWVYLGLTAKNNVTGTDSAGYQIEEPVDV